MRHDIEGKPNYTEKENLAYCTYASLYLDFVDDNMDHFYNRVKDIEPVIDLSSKDELKTVENIYQTYLQSAIEIANIAVASGYYATFKDLYKEYPLLKEVSDVIENAFYDNEYLYDCNYE